MHIYLNYSRLPNSQHAAVVSGGGFFSWGTKFKYTGRTEREILTESINALREQKLTHSSTSKRKASSVPATPSSPQGDLAQIRKLLRNTYIASKDLKHLNLHSGYSSLPRSTMSEPLSNCTMVATDNPNNIAFTQNIGYDVTGNSGVQVPSLEPVSEEARMRASSNFENINLLNNCGSADISNFYLKSEDSMLYSTPESSTFNAYDGESSISPRNFENIPNTYFHQPQTTRTTANSNYIPSTTSNDPSSDNQYANSAKGVRKFHFINAFIPSVVFVVIAMVISAIIVLESDSDLFEQIRNLPEMLSLRYQYYQPLKEYILQKVTRKT